MKALFIAAGSLSWGSSRMRCFWPARYMDAGVITFEEVEKSGDYPAGIDAVIFQKYINPAVARQYLDAGVQVWWDVCDPSWWFSPKEAAETVRHVTGVVCSSQALEADFREWGREQGESFGHRGPGLGSIKLATIPDRLELSHFPKQRKHADVSPVRFIWFGVAVNRIALFAAVANLDRLWANGYRFELTIMDDRPDSPFIVGQQWPVYHVRWSLEHENEILASHDIALLPPYPGPWGEVKSNNKALTAWVNRLPAIDGQDYQDMILAVTDASWRKDCGKHGRATVGDSYDVRQSATEWEKLLGGNQAPAAIPFNDGRAYAYTNQALIQQQIRELERMVESGALTAEQAESELKDFCETMTGARCES